MHVGEEEKLTITRSEVSYSGQQARCSPYMWPSWWSFEKCKKKLRESQLGKSYIFTMGQALNAPLSVAKQHAIHQLIVSDQPKIVQQWSSYCRGKHSSKNCHCLAVLQKRLQEKRTATKDNPYLHLTLSVSQFYRMVENDFYIYIVPFLTGNQNVL